MRFIPLQLLSEVLDDPWYEKCCLSGRTPVNLHHNLIHAGGQVNEKWCILPLHPDVHTIEKRRDVRELLDWIMLSRASMDDLRTYSKVDNLVAKRDRLVEKYGKYDGKTYPLKGYRTA